jgi:hypothetical protein
MVNLFKWQLVSLTKYDFVLYTDADVDVMTEETDAAFVRARWRAMLPLLLLPTDAPNATWAVANADYSAPLHGGMLLLRPSTTLYGEGLRVLADGGFNYTHGFELRGPPAQLGFAARHIDGTPARDVGVGNDPHVCSGMFRNAWDFVNAYSDQGFLWYMFYIRHERGAYFRYDSNAHHKILHWWTGPKPWDALRPNASTTDSVATHLLTRAYSYLHRSELRGGEDPRADPTVRALWLLRRAIEDDPRWMYIKSTNSGPLSTYPLW